MNKDPRETCGRAEAKYNGNRAVTVSRLPVGAERAICKELHCMCSRVVSVERMGGGGGALIQPNDFVLSIGISCH